MVNCNFSRDFIISITVRFYISYWFSNPMKIAYISSNRVDMRKHITHLILINEQSPMGLQMSFCC